MLTTIQIAGLQTFGYHGLFEEERSLGQKFSFDIDATLNPAPTHRDDRLDASIRYDAVVDAAVSLASRIKYQTLEALGEAVAIGLLRRFALIETITVGVSKFSPQSRIRSAKSESRCAWRAPIWRIGRLRRRLFVRPQLEAIVRELIKFERVKRKHAQISYGESD
jgi:dihydroneopterin aldolase